MKRLLLLSLLILLSSVGIIFAQTEQLLINETFQSWAAKSAVDEVSTQQAKTLYGEDITYSWRNFSVQPEYVAKSDNGVTSKGAVCNDKKALDITYFQVSGISSVTKAILKHSYTGGSRGCIISAKGDGDAGWVELYSANTTAAGGQSAELQINRTNVSLRFQGNLTAQYAYLHDMLVYGNTSQVVPILGSINYENGDIIPHVGGEIKLTFSENVYRNTGDITLGGVVIPESNITIDNSIVTIAYGAIATDASHILSIAAGAFKNSAGTGTASLISYTYKTADTVKPTLIEASVKNDDKLPTTGFVSLIMSEPCKAGSVSISIGSKTVSASPSASNSNLLFINYNGLESDTDYTITIPSGAITDLAGNSYDDNFTCTFRTAMDSKGAKLLSFIPDATSMPSTSSGTVAKDIDGYQVEFVAVSGAGARTSAPYTYSFKCNYVQLPPLPSVGEIGFYVQSGGGTSPQKYNLQKLDSDGSTWKTIETFILGTNDKNWLRFASAQSSVPVTLRLAYAEAPLWFYDMEVYAYQENLPVDDGKNPTVVVSIPENSATDISINGNIKLTFSESVYVGNTTIALNGKALTPSVLGKSITLPYFNLKYATSYTLTIPQGAFKDAFNNESDAYTLSFTTKAKLAVSAKLFNFVVAQDGSGNGTSIQSAFDAVPAANNSPFLIFVKNGIYNERPSLADGKNNVSLIGESVDGVIITNDKRSGVDGLTTSTCQTVEILADNFYSENITMQNTAGVDAGQAVALKVYANKAVFKNIRLLGYQDTHLTSNVATDRQYYKNCDIRGSVDFIFGDGIAYFDNCKIYIEDRNIPNVIAAPATASSNMYGYVFGQCTIDGASSQDGVYHLGRPWKNSPRAVYIDTKMNLIPAVAGWTNMSAIPALFAEYGSVNSANTPIDVSKRTTSYSYTSNGTTYSGESATAILPQIDLANYTLEKVLAGADSWDATYKTDETASPANLKVTNSTLTWDAVDGAISYLVLNNGKVEGFTSSASYTVGIGNYSVIAVAEYGALSRTSENILVGDTKVNTDKLDSIFIKSNIISNEIEFNNVDKIERFDLRSLNSQLLASSKSAPLFSMSKFRNGIYLLTLHLTDGKKITNKILKL